MVTAAATSLAEQQRHAYARAILGEELFGKVADAHVLVVGAGGIGCELLKNLVLVGFGNIEIIDLDTIDLSNLNRQFLFQKQHIKKSKALVARDTAHGFNPHVEITAIHGNVKEGRFGLSYFKKFDLVLNALDNLDARRWVNKMCMAAEVPLVESGTTGFLGQVQPIMKGVTECYDCTPKPTPRTYPVCTIRSTPSTPIHCVVWAKSWLFIQLFGTDDETEEQELDKAVANGEDANEIDNLRTEAREMRDIRARLSEAGAAERVFNKVYKADIERLLGMEEMWASRSKPTPLEFEVARASASGSGTMATEGDKEAARKHKTSLKDQRQLSLAENVELFARSLAALSERAAANPSEPLSFDKDDDDALDFVTAASNLRAHVYAIEEKTRFQVKEMAGNIIPAIASTNAIIAGMLVLQALHALRRSWSAARFVSLSRTTQRVFTSFPPSRPNPACGVCQDVYISLRADTSRLTLGELVEDIAKRSRDEGGMGIEAEVGVYESSRLLYDPDFEDNVEKTLKDLGAVAGTMIAVVDEDGEKATVNFVIEEMESNADAPAFQLPSSLPALADKAPIPKASNDEDSDLDDDVVVTEAPTHLPAAGPSKKRAAPDEASDEAEKGEASKKRRAEGGDGNGETDGKESNKKRRKGTGGEEHVIVLE